MYCQNCGYQNKDGDMFCASCGARLQQPNPPGFGTPVNGMGRVNMNMSAAAGNMPAGQRAAPQAGVFVIIGEAVLLVAAVLLLSSLGKKYSGSEHVAECFFVHIANQDWEGAYDYLDLEESEFVNREMFAAANRGKALGEVSNYNVQVKEYEASNGVQRIMDMMDGTTPGDTVSVTYRTKGNSFDQFYGMMLNESGKKKWLFYDQWKISAQPYLCKDYEIRVFKGADVTLDGILLDESYCEDTESDTVDCYKIPQICSGYHTIEIAEEDYETVKRQIMMEPYDDAFYQESLYLSEDTQDALIQAAGSAMEEIYGAALAGREFASIQGLFTSEEETIAGIRQSYEYLRENLSQRDGVGPFQLTFQNRTGQSYNTGSSVDISYEYTVGYTYRDWDDRIQTDMESGSGYDTFQFQKEDGKWVLTNLGCEGVYW